MLKDQFRKVVDALKEAADVSVKAVQEGLEEAGKVGKELSERLDQAMEDAANSPAGIKAKEEVLEAVAKARQFTDESVKNVQASLDENLSEYRKELDESIVKAKALAKEGTDAASEKTEQAIKAAQDAYDKAAVASREKAAAAIRALQQELNKTAADLLERLEKSKEA